VTWSMDYKQTEPSCVPCRSAPHMLVLHLWSSSHHVGV
jgi:hypothetical protein